MYLDGILCNLNSRVVINLARKILLEQIGYDSQKTAEKVCPSIIQVEDKPDPDQGERSHSRSTVLVPYAPRPPLSSPPDALVDLSLMASLFSPQLLLPLTPSSLTC